MNTIEDRASDIGVVRRAFQMGADFEFRSTQDGTGFTFEGLGSTVDYGYTAEDKFGKFTEIIQAGAFDKSIQERGSFKNVSQRDDIGLYVNHGWQWGQVPLASRNAGTMRLRADPNLRVAADLDPARPDVQIVRSAVTRGELPEMSVGFNPVKDRSIWNADYTEVVRTEVKLKEISLTQIGCSDATSTSMRGVADYSELMRALTNGTMTKHDVGRLLTVAQTRFADLFDNMIEARLRDELNELLNPGPDGFVCVIDHTDNVVIYCVYGIGDDDQYQLGYTADADGNITLSTDAPIVVQSVTSYVPEPPEPRSAVFELRDREDAARFEMLRSVEPALLLSF